MTASSHASLHRRTEKPSKPGAKLITEEVSVLNYAAKLTTEECPVLN
jgi:hypothetical protein